MSNVSNNTVYILFQLTTVALSKFQSEAQCKHKPKFYVLQW